MREATFERALHMWPEWTKSIETSRKELGYHQRWSKGRSVRWIERNISRVKEKGSEELARLDLPPNLQQYGEDCFYRDYLQTAGSVDYGKIVRRLAKKGKSLPPLPCDHGIVWHGDEDVDTNWLRIEIRVHSRFATREIFDYAARHAFSVLQGHISDRKIEPHPVATLINRAKVASPARTGNVLKVWNDLKNIDDTLNRLYFLPETQAELAQELSHWHEGYERHNAEKAFRKQFRDRVTRTLKKFGIKLPGPKRKWWITGK